MRILKRIIAKYFLSKYFYKIFIDYSIYLCYDTYVFNYAERRILMANRYLIPVFKKLFDSDFSYFDFNNRMEMQKGIYLLQDMGVPIGDYGFRWYLHGPYSQSLQDDMYYESGRPEATIALSEENAACIRKLHDIIHSPSRGPYSISAWVECLASIRYLKENILCRVATEDEIITKLTQKKPHLDNPDVNHTAYQYVESLFA